MKLTKREYVNILIEFMVNILIETKEIYCMRRPAVHKLVFVEMNPARKQIL